jgi:hypothetical protein
MTAIAVTAPACNATNHKMYYMMQGPGDSPGASIKVIKITPPTSYTSTGDALDLSALFKRRIYWLMFMNPTVINDGVDFAQVGYEPGTAKTDKRGGYSPTDGKIVFSTGSTESSGDLSAYPVYAVVCGC